MPTVTCPSCGEKGRILETLVGARIKCRKCATSFLVAPPAPKASAAPVSAPLQAVGAAISEPPLAAKKGDANQIEVDGLDDSAWTSSPAVATVDHDQDHEHPEHHAEEVHPAFTVHPEMAGIKHYKILTPKDKFFEGKFDLDKLEQALNHFAKQGWVVRGMSTPHVAGFSGGDKEQLIILLER